MDATVGTDLERAVDAAIPAWIAAAWPFGIRLRPARLGPMSLGGASGLNTGASRPGRPKWSRR